MLSRWLLRLRAVLRRQEVEAEFDEELRYHFDLEVERLIAGGADPQEACRAARRSIGDPGALKEEARETWRWRGVDELSQDLRYAVRSLIAHPTFTAMTLLALTVGIGLNTSLFTAVNALLFRPWSVSDPERMVHLFSRHPRYGLGGLPVSSAADFVENGATIEGAFAQRSYSMTLGEGPDAQTVRAALVSRSYFDVLGVPPLVGRTFAESEDVPSSPSAVAVISALLWREVYGADPGVIGKAIHLDGLPFTVIGIAANAFRGTAEGRTDLWAPLSAIMLLRPRDPSNLARLTDPEYCCSEVYARLAPGSTFTQAGAELSTAYRQFSAGAARDVIEVAVTGTAALDHPELRSRAAPIIAILLAAFGSLLLLACANVSNMLLAQGAVRQHEIAVRAALGAGRGRMIRQLLTESFLLAGLAALLSLLLASLLPPLAARIWSDRAMGTLNLAPDGTVFAYALGIGTLSALAFGVVPAIHSTRIPVGVALKGHGRMSARLPFQGLLVGVQVAVSVALLVAAVLAVRGLDRARSLDLGFRSEGVTALRVELPRNSYDPAEERDFFDDLLMRLESDGTSVAMSSLLPLTDTRNLTDFAVPGSSATLEQLADDRAQGRPLVPVQSVTATYFDVLAIPVVAGRPFRPQDRDAGAILVNESLAQLYWPDRTPLGQSVTIGQRSREVVGVVGDARLFGVGQGGPMYFTPFAANSQAVGEPSVILVPSPVSSRVAAAVRRAEANAIIRLVPLTEQADASLGDSRRAMQVAAMLAWLALLLATTGVYSVISYSVEQRRQEIGTRVALGAEPREVLRLVLRRNATPILTGLFIGLVISAGEFLLLSSQLYGLSPLDPLTVAAVALILVLTGAAASAIPAKRALRIHPLTALQ